MPATRTIVRLDDPALLAVLAAEVGEATAGRIVAALETRNSRYVHVPLHLLIAGRLAIRSASENLALAADKELIPALALIRAWLSEGRGRSDALIRFANDRIVAAGGEVSEQEPEEPGEAAAVPAAAAAPAPAPTPAQTSPSGRQRRPITDPVVLQKRREALSRARARRAENIAAARAAGAVAS